MIKITNLVLYIVTTVIKGKGKTIGVTKKEERKIDRKREGKRNSLKTADKDHVKVEAQEMSPYLEKRTDEWTFGPWSN